MPPRITAIARKHLRDPLELRVAAEAVAPGEAPRIRQTAYLVPRSHKLAALGRILDVESPAAALVFCRTRTEVDEVTRTLSARGYRPEALHGGMSQEQRDRVMRLFRAGTADLLIATDVAARGLDVEHLSHVINYHVPEAAESYVHRIGRVGRAGREGVALTLAEGREQRQLRNIERATRQTIHIAPVPSVAELRTRQMQRTRELLRETILGGNLNRQRELLDSLAEEFDVADIALAALELAQRAEGAEEAPSEIPAVEPFGRRDQERGRDRWRDQEAPRKGTVKRRGPAPGMARVYVGIGYEDGIAPRDLVGAIANEVGIPGRDIGAIEITGRFSLVDVPEEAEEDVIEGLRRARVRGRRVMVRPDRDGQRGR